MTADVGPVQQIMRISFGPLLTSGEEFMRFRLTYAGPLLSSGKGKGIGAADHKHEIRRVFHTQLRRLHEVSPVLQIKERLVYDGGNLTDGPTWHAVKPGEFVRNGYEFIPLVTDRSNVFVSLNILYLRNGVPGKLLINGDIDNRLKTIFDALRMPNGSQELGQYTTPSPDEVPFYVLLQDDALITQVSVETDDLLEPIPSASGYRREHDARLIITVEIHPAV